MVLLLPDVECYVEEMKSSKRS